jgi:hypothetical protein
LFSVTNATLETYFMGNFEFVKSELLSNVLLLYQSKYLEVKRKSLIEALPY